MTQCHLALVPAFYSVCIFFSPVSPTFFCFLDSTSTVAFCTGVGCCQGLFALFWMRARHLPQCLLLDLLFLHAQLSAFIYLQLFAQYSFHNLPNFCSMRENIHRFFIFLCKQAQPQASRCDHKFLISMQADIIACFDLLKIKFL